MKVCIFESYIRVWVRYIGEEPTPKNCEREEREGDEEGEKKDREEKEIGEKEKVKACLLIR